MITEITDAVDRWVPSIAPFPRILVIDAEPDMRTKFENGLGTLGFDVKVVKEGRAAVHATKEWVPEAILVDGAIPGIDAVSLVVCLRRVTDVPILMISNDCETPYKLLSLSHGADDHITKPFDFDEIAAYIRARLRRPRMEVRDIVNYADLTIDVSQRKVARAGERIDLSAREFDLLLALARHPEQVYTRTQLLDIVWGSARDITLATVETYISYILQRSMRPAAKN